MLKKHIIIAFALLALLFLISCSATEKPTITAPTLPTVSFALKDNIGNPVNTSSSLKYGNIYTLTVSSVGGDEALRTADYSIASSPASAITINIKRSNSIRFIVNTGTTVKITATHKNNIAITGTVDLNFINPDTPTTDFARDIQGGNVPSLASVSSPLTREVLGPLGAGTNASVILMKKYATELGTGNQDGSSWANAWAATNLRNGINGITNASTNRIYLIMVAGGTYKPSYDTSPSREDSFQMSNHIAIMGGFETGGGWERTGTTIFSGDINNDNNPSGNSYHVFYHNRITLANAHLYGVVIADGNADAIAGAHAFGGGMYNLSSSPVLTRVTFRNNTAGYGGGIFNDSSSTSVISNSIFDGNTAIGTGLGGGIYNRSSSPLLTGVTFRNNTAGQGAGMYNRNGASPVLSTTVFSGNTATANGGGMYNYSSSPVISDTVFSGNTAIDGGGMFNTLNSYPTVKNAVFINNSVTGNGGGMYNSAVSIPAIVGAVFRSNSALNGGGMANNNNSPAGPIIVNTIFADNTTNSGAGFGPDIAVNTDNSDTENIRIAGSVLGIGLANPTSGIVSYGGSATLTLSHHYLTNGAVNFGADATIGDLIYPTIGAGSSATNLGLFVRERISSSPPTYYFSENNANWYTSFSATGGWGTGATLPAGTEDLTAKDIAGKERTGRPEAGVFELP